LVAESGKSTLTAALVRRGATFFSDEFAVLDDKHADGRIDAKDMQYFPGLFMPVFQLLQLAYPLAQAFQLPY